MLRARWHLPAILRVVYATYHKLDVQNLGYCRVELEFLVRRLATVAILALAISGVLQANSDVELTADELMAKVLDQTRGLSSYSELTMTINRPDWKRTSSFSVWTRGREDALIRFTAPARDAGFSTLKKGERMWTYSPKIQRTVRLPKSMMSQDWAGSDFSYNDLARSDDLLNEYTLRLANVDQSDDGTIYTIEAIPKENAPVVWGKEVVVLRDDFVLLRHSYYDQEMVLVKWLETLEIDEFDGRTIPKRMRIRKSEEEDSWTEVSYEKADFDIEIDESMFTLFALRGSE